MFFSLGLLFAFEFMGFVWVYVSICPLGVCTFHVLPSFCVYSYTKKERCASHRGPEGFGVGKLVSHHHHQSAGQRTER